MKTESRTQQDCAMWFWNTYPQHRGKLFEINNNSENAREGMKHKCMGRVKGVADMCLLAPDGVTVFLEFKTETGTQSPAQKEWERTITAAGHRYCIVRSEQEFRNLIKIYL
jgi:4-aminobutyrate aminotransferase-like enzyme